MLERNNVQSENSNKIISGKFRECDCLHKFDNLPHRGRQSLKFSLGLPSDKNLSSKHPLKTSLCHQLKRKEKAKKLQRSRRLLLEEEYESSESDYSMTKRKYLYNDIEYEEESQFSLREDDEDKNDISSDLQLHYEDKLNFEIEKILISIYNGHILYNNSRRKLDFSKYSKHITMFSRNLNEQSNIFIVQLFTEKVKELMKRYKEKILEIAEIKEMREKFLKKKKSLAMNQVNNEEILCSVNNYNQNILSASSNGENRSPFKKKSPIDSHRLLSSNDSSFQSFISTYSNKLNEKTSNEISNKSVTRILLLELRNIKRSLIKSSVDIEKVFKYPFKHLTIKGKIVHFSIEDIHIEEFTRTLVEDEFIASLISQIKLIAWRFNISEIKELISQIEDNKFNKKKEMSRLTHFLEKKVKFFLDVESMKDEYENFQCGAAKESVNSFIKKDKEKEKENSPETKHLKKNQCNMSQTSTPTLTPTSTTSISSTTKKGKAFCPTLDIDDLVKFIESENGKSKKSKKKNKSSKQIIEKDENINIQFEESKSNHSYERNISEDIYDKEVEDFKKSIVQESFKAYSKNKIKPCFTQEWLRNFQCENKQ